MRILIVEDEKPIANLIDLNLSSCGYQCVCVHDGLAAADLLEEGMTTVGVHMNAEHNKASAIGAKVTARATLVEHTGRSFHFTVEAYEGDEQVGVGEHTRVAVDRVRFMAKLAK